MKRINIILTLLLMPLPLVAASLEDIRLPPGFVIAPYAEVPNARSLALGERGTVFVGNRKGQSVYAVVEKEGGGTRVAEILRHLYMPNGIAVHGGALYVAEINRVTRYADVENRLDDMPEGEVLDIELPSNTTHGWRYIGFGPDGKLYISIGAPCNVCEEPGYATIVRMNPDGSEREVFARGVRNSVGFDRDPSTGELWFHDNGRDWLGDDLPADELNHAKEAGLHFGYPYCHAGEILDPEFGQGHDCDDYVAPAQKLGAHVAALGLLFYTGNMFPAQYRGQIFIAEHGSWNRSKKAGYRVSLVRLEAGVPVSYEPFAEGWLQGESVSGRPVDLLQLADGSLLVSDDAEGQLYRISYVGARE